MVAADHYRQVFEGLVTLADLQRALDEVSRSLGFQTFAYHVVRPPVGGKRICMNATTADSEQGCNGEEVQCPEAILGQLGHMTLPYRWDHLDGTAAGRKGLARLFGEPPGPGPVFGVTVPLHGPAGGLAALCFAGPQLPPALKCDWASCRDNLILIGFRARQAALNGCGQDKSGLPHLTARESEILLWTARGKTAWETGEILEISDETVRFHLKNATRKFGVFSKHQAVVEAIMGGLIVP